MARLSGNRIAWEYTDANGAVWRVAAQKAVTDQQTAGLVTKVGGQAWAGTAPAKPGTIKMRRITCNSTGNGSRVIPVYAPGAPILTAGTTINLNIPGGTDSASYVSSGYAIPESWKRAPSVTTQST